jgi:hypothetical protein
MPGFQIEPVKQARLLYRKCVEEFPDWNQHLLENEAAVEYIDKQLAAFNAAADWDGDADWPTKLATATAFLNLEMGVYTLLPCTFTGNRTEPYYRLTVQETQLTLPEEEYLAEGALNETFFKDYGEQARYYNRSE